MGGHPQGQSQIVAGHPDHVTIALSTIAPSSRAHLLGFRVLTSCPVHRSGTVQPTFRVFQSSRYFILDIFPRPPWGQCLPGASWLREEIPEP